jgi:hypothetical protein
MSDPQLGQHASLIGHDNSTHSTRLQIAQRSGSPSGVRDEMVISVALGVQLHCEWQWQ